MQDQENYILQLRDLVTGRSCAVRIGRQDSSLPLSGVLEKYLRDCPVQRLLEEGRITDESSEALQAIQDLVYLSSDTGRLQGMFPGVEFKQDGRAIALDAVPEAELTTVGEKGVALIDVGIDRTNVGYDRNWVGFHRRRWDRHADLYTGFVLECLRREYSEREAAAILRVETKTDKLKLLSALARRIWESPFESYSRFIGDKLVYKTGDETVRNIMAGAGGICSEKVQALKFLTDGYGIESEYALAGAETVAPVPEDKLRELLTTFDFRFAKRYMRYWQHAALVYTIDGTTVLVDATNGNIPFMFLEDEAAERLLGYDDKSPVAVRMAVYEEDFYYHRVSQDIPEKLYFAMEGWVEDVDLIQVFDNELGLYISSEFFVTPVVFRSPPAYERLRQKYMQVCDRARLECSVSEEWTLDSPLGRRFVKQEGEVAERILLARDHLLSRYDECHGPNHEAGLAIISLFS